MGLRSPSNHALLRRTALFGPLRIGCPSSLLGSSRIFNGPSEILPGAGNSLRDHDDLGHDSLRQLVSNALGDSPFTFRVDIEAVRGLGYPADH